jgi:hypothetical protein
VCVSTHVRTNQGYVRSELLYPTRIPDLYRLFHCNPDFAFDILSNYPRLLTIAGAQRTVELWPAILVLPFPALAAGILPAQEPTPAIKELFHVLIIAHMH